MTWYGPIYVWSMIGCYLLYFAPPKWTLKALLPRSIWNSVSTWFNQSSNTIPHLKRFALCMSHVAVEKLNGLKGEWQVTRRTKSNIIVWYIPILKNINVNRNFDNSLNQFLYLKISLSSWDKWKGLSLYESRNKQVKD